MSAAPSAHGIMLNAAGDPIDAIASYGTQLQVRSSADGVTPKEFTTVFGVGDIDGPSLSIDEIETTNHSTGVPIKTFIPALIDPGELGFPCFWNPLDPTQSPLSPYGMENLFYARKVTDWRLIATDPARTTRQFRGFLKEKGEAYPVAGVVTHNIKVRISGAMAYVQASVTVTPATATPAAAGGAATATVATTDEQAWFPVALQSWITITAPTGPTVGNGSISYTIATNDTLAPRTGQILVGDKTFTITRADV